MNLTTVLVTASAVLTIASIIPYLIDITRHKTKPRIVSWFNWTLLTGIAGAAALADKQYPAAALSFAAALETASVVILGLKYGDRKFDITDVLCQIGAIAGLVLWIVFNSPAIAVIASVGIDFTAGIPTLKHAWQKPQEETAIAFVICSFAAALTLLAVREVSLTALTYPLYILGINVAMSAILLLRKPIVEKRKQC